MTTLHRLTDLIFGKFDILIDLIVINHLLLLGKYYIYCIYLPTLRGFISRRRRLYNIELHIARGKNKLQRHFQWWEKVLNNLINYDIPAGLFFFNVLLQGLCNCLKNLMRQRQRPIRESKIHNCMSCQECITVKLYSFAFLTLGLVSIMSLPH